MLGNFKGGKDRKLLSKYLDAVEVIVKGVAEPLPGHVVEEEIGGGVQGGREVAQPDEGVGHCARHRLVY